jgi:TM2 domain-containing membrane protein YozV
MEDAKIDQFTLLHGNKFATEDLLAIRERLKELDDSKFTFVIAQDYHSPNTLFWVSFFLGIFGVDRFMIGHTGLGVAKLFLSWATLWIWCLVDWLFFIKKATKTANFEKFQTAAML